MLFGVSILFGFAVSGLFIRRPQYIQVDYDSDNSNKSEEDLMQLYLEHSEEFDKQIEEEPESNLSEDELKYLKNKEINYYIPPIKQNLRMYYDHNKQAFCYFSKSDIIYKYLDFATKYYVITYKCKQLYVSLEESKMETKNEEKDTTNSLFLKKPEKKLLCKKVIKFIYMGNEEEYNYMNNLNTYTSPTTNINILDFINMKLDNENTDFEKVEKLD
jgi:hypothetical protein